MGIQLPLLPGNRNISRSALCRRFEPTFFGLGFFELGTCNEERKAACAGTRPSLTSAPIA